MTKTLHGFIAACTALAVVTLSIGGCNILGPAASVIAGPGKVEREYELDRNRKTTILIDDPSNKVAQRRLRALIGERAQETLMRRKLVLESNMIDTRSAMAAAAQGTESEPITITEIADTVGAEIIVYAVVTDFAISPDGITYQPSATMRVIVVDATSREQLWPESPEGFPVTVEPPASPDRSALASRTAAFDSMQSLAELAGEGLAQVFYTMERPQSVRR